MFELLLVSVIIVTGYLGLQLWQAGGPDRRPYAYMLLGDGALALISVAYAHTDAGATRLSDTLGAVAAGGFVCLVMLPPVLRDLTRRALGGDRIGLALRLLEVREFLQPGMGAKQDRDMIATDAAVRAGHVDEALTVLRARRAAAAENPMLRRALDERIVMTLLYARRWRQALDHFERTIEAQPGPVTPPLLVEVVRAYGEEGDLAKAANLMDRLERSPVAHEPMLALLLARARMVFLAFVGRATEVEALLAPAGILGIMPPAVRAYWIGVARLHGGDADGARAALTDAMTMAGRDRRARQIAEDLLARIDRAGGAESDRGARGHTIVVTEAPPDVASRNAPAPAPSLLAPEILELADRVAVSSRKPPLAAEPGPRIPRLEGVAVREIPVTAGLIVANVLVALLVAWRLGSSEDTAVLVAAGANLKQAVRAGEFWRLDASTFLHVGMLHLALNMYGLWVLGRLAEQLLGPARLFAVYSLAGMGGAVASLLFGGDGISAGASGAVMGLCGAAIAELGLHRKAYPERWRGALLKNLVFITVMQLVIGGAYPAIDQAAHVGGLVAGALTATVLARGTWFGRSIAARVLTVILCAASVASIGYSVYGVATTRYADTLQRVPWQTHVDDGVTFEAPGLWLPVKDKEAAHETEGAYVDPVYGLAYTLVVDQGTGDRDAMLRSSLKDGATAIAPSYAPPDGWISAEYRIHAEGGGKDELVHQAVFARPLGEGRGVRMMLIVPEREHAALAPIVARLLGSVRVSE